MKLKLIICILTLGTICSPCFASNALRGKLFSAKCKKSARKEFKIDKNVMMKRQPSLTHEDVAKIIPTQYEENETSQRVVSRILQNSANAVLNSDIIKNSFLMKTAKQVENTTKVDVAIKQDDEAGALKATEHKFNFDLQALKGQAKITYSGLINSKVEYQAANDTFLVAFEESLSENSKIALSHLKDREQSRQLVQYEINW